MVRRFETEFPKLEIGVGIIVGLNVGIGVVVWVIVGYIVPSGLTSDNASRDFS